MKNAGLEGEVEDKEEEEVEDNEEKKEL